MMNLNRRGLLGRGLGLLGTLGLGPLAPWKAEGAGSPEGVHYVGIDRREYAARLLRTGKAGATLTIADRPPESYASGTRVETAVTLAGVLYDPGGDHRPRTNSWHRASDCAGCKVHPYRQWCFRERRWALNPEAEMPDVVRVTMEEGLPQATLVAPSREERIAAGEAAERKATEALLALEAAPNVPYEQNRRWLEQDQQHAREQLVILRRG